jgi:P27 family predicted phage terminase small subunit
MKGRPPKPTIIKEMQGTLRKSRLVENEIQPSIEVGLQPPSDLNEWGVKLWQDITSEYFKLGLITKVDVASLQAVCMEWGVYCEASDLVSAQGIQVVDDKGNHAINPARKVASDAFKNYKSMCVEFGLTPASRTRISAPEQKDKDPFNEFH